MDWTPEPEPSPPSTGWSIYSAVPDISEAEIKSVGDALSSSQLSGRSPVVGEAEQMFAAFVGVRHAVAVNSGGSALMLMLKAIGVMSGDYVVVPSFTMVATAGAVSQLGATPVFVDCNRDTLNISPQQLACCLSDMKSVGITPKAVIAVHLYGHPCEMDALSSITRDIFGESAVLLGDAAEACGGAAEARCGNDRARWCGSFGTAEAFGFYANKNLTAGELGMVTTNSDQIADRVRELRSYCFTPGVHFWHREIGYSMRPNGLAAAFFKAQIQRRNDIFERRRAVADYYELLFREWLPDIERSKQLPGYRHGWWHYWIRLSNRMEIRHRLASIGIETRPGFVPMHVQPVYRYHCRSNCPESEAAGREVLLLPTHTLMREDMIECVVREIKRGLGR